MNSSIFSIPHSCLGWTITVLILSLGVRVKDKTKDVTRVSLQRAFTILGDQSTEGFASMSLMHSRELRVAMSCASCPLRVTV